MSEVVAEQQQERTMLSRTKEVGLRLAGCLLATGVVTAPAAVQYGIEHAEVHDAIGPLPATIGYSASGYSQLETPLGAAYLPQTEYGIGLKAKVELPADKTIADLISPESQRLLVAQYGAPETVAQGYQELLWQDTKDEIKDKWLSSTLTYGGVLFIGAQGLAYYRRNPAVPKKVVAGATVGLSLATAANSYFFGDYHDWQQRERVAGELYAVNGLGNTDLQSLSVDKTVLKAIIENAAPATQKYLQRQQIENDNFRSIMEVALEDQSSHLEAPRDDEQAIILFSDMHANQLATEFLAATIAAYQAQHSDRLVAVLSVGDNTITGTAGEANNLQAQVAAAGETEIAGIIGNHDSLTTSNILENAGLVILDDTVKEIGGVPVLGMTDPTLTEFLGPNIPRDGDVSQADVGREARDLATNDDPSVILVHEAYSAAAFLSVPNIQDVPVNAENYQLFGEDEVVNVPADLIAYGHWHDEVEPRVLYNSDGSWSVIAELGTAGGAIEASTLSNFSLPNAPPKKPASSMLFFRNESSGLISGYQRIVLNPDGSVVITTRTDIGSSDGQPFTIYETSRRKDAPVEQTKQTTN